MSVIRWLPVLGAILFPAALQAASSVADPDNPHNLSTSGPGPIRATAENRTCIFCHAPHNAAPNTPLWNRNNPDPATYTPYTSSTALAATSSVRPTGASLMCLSCHDGTIALGQTVSSPGSPISITQSLITGRSSLGTNLSDDHPISFNYSIAQSNPELVAATALTQKVRLDPSGQLQCTSCHDSHDNTYGMFLVVNSKGGALCTNCHAKNGWTTSSHAVSTSTWNGTAPDPWTNVTAKFRPPAGSWTSVADFACDNCHKQHTAAGTKRLLNSNLEENNCYPCHNGNVAKTNIQAVFTKASALQGHYVAGNPATTSDTPNGPSHDPKESAVVTTRHVECEDCHNPHATGTAPADFRSPGSTIIARPGSLNGVRGINRFGVEVGQVSAEYEVCFRCHASSPNKRAAYTTRVSGGPLGDSTNVNNAMTDFDPTNASFHSVVGAKASASTVPSLIAAYGWTTGSMMTCTDCHNSEQGRILNGDGTAFGSTTGPAGPHASAYQGLLALNFKFVPSSTINTTGNTVNTVTFVSGTGTNGTAALCFRCHSETVIFNGPAPFSGGNGHSKHVKDERTSCNVCHDPHGVKRIPTIQTGTNTVTNSGIGLINFDRSVVAPLTGQTEPRFVASTTVGRGSCYLRCHGQNHNPENY